MLDHASVVGVPQHDLGVEGVDDLAAVCFEIRRGVVLYQRLNGCDVLFEGRIVEVVFGGLAQRGYGMTRLRLVGDLLVGDETLEVLVLVVAYGEGAHVYLLAVVTAHVFVRPILHVAHSV